MASPSLTRASFGERWLPGFRILLAAMFVELLLAPILALQTDRLPAARVVTLVVLMAALLVVRRGRGALVLAVPTLVAQALASYDTGGSVVVVATVLRLVFLCYVVGVVVWYALTARSITAETIAATACAYMLLGVVWANLYQLVERLHPGSLEIPASWMMGGADPEVALTYFSFVTLATVGYGDIKPMNPGVGGLCVAEALVGQLYLAIMIARMVGLQISQRTG